MARKPGTSEEEDIVKSLISKDFSREIILETCTDPFLRLDEKEIRRLLSMPKNMLGFIYVPLMNLYVAKEKIHKGKNWYDAHEALGEEDSRMLTMPEFVGFLNHLRENPSEENTRIYNGITQVSDSFRSEWIDTYFEQRNDGMHVLTRNKTREEKLEDNLTKHGVISLEDWLDNPTSQGLPRSDIKRGDLHYRSPMDGYVLRFDEYFYKTILELSCPSNGFSVGVRAVKEVA